MSADIGFEAMENLAANSVTGATGFSSSVEAAFLLVSEAEGLATSVGDREEDAFWSG